jgi:hypothetical protein
MQPGMMKELHDDVAVLVSDVFPSTVPEFLQRASRKAHKWCENNGLWIRIK